MRPPHPLTWPFRKAWNTWLWRIVPYVSFALSHLRSTTQVALQWPDPSSAPVPVGGRVVLFVHYDGAGRVRPYVLQYLRSLQSEGLSILFVSNAGQLLPAALESLKPLCAGILVRRNIGYDFAAMREALLHFGLPRADTQMLIIANDSVYGPLAPLRQMLARIDFEHADFWGATESWQSRYHLQSFFMVAGPRLLAHPAWAAFWAQVRPVTDKRWVITRYEVGITQWMIRAGLRCQAIWRYRDLVQDIEPDLLIRDPENEPEQIDPVLEMRRTQSRRIRECFVNRIALNPTSDMWRQLLNAGFPFLKRELLRDNPTFVADVMDWREVVATTTHADITLIERDLQRLVRNVAP